MKARKFACVLVGICGCCSAAASADVKLPALFSDHMLLQRDAEVPIWGSADPNEPITVQADWMNEPAKVQSDNSGHWKAQIKTPAPGGPHTLIISGKNTIKLSDVLIGEVWVCSGQSNMEFPLRAADNAAAALKSADRPQIRLFDVENAVAASPRDDCRGSWSPCTPDSAKGFSAVGYFFAVKLADELKVPVGMIEADWGGTPAEAWTSAEGLKSFPEFTPALDQMHALAAHGPESAEDRARAVEAWRTAIDDKDPGMRDHWMKPTADTRGWQTISVPGPWKDDLAGFDGVLWNAREIDIPAAWAGRDLTLEFGPIDDCDDTYFNGELVGKAWDAGAFSRPRKYTIPGKLVHQGKNTLTVRILDTGGPGGIGGEPHQQRLGPAGEKPISLAGEWNAKVGVEISKLPPRPPSREVGPGMPSSLFNGMIAPIAGYGIRGAIWYQGEANVGRAQQYARLFPAMIADWRRLWNLGDFPFYFVQIAPFNYDGDRGQAAELRESQLKTLALPNTGMAVTMDIGNPADIHPRDKVDVGNRLALWAVVKTYGRTGTEFTGPTFRRLTIDGSTARIQFDHAEGLTARGGGLTHFQLAGPDGKFADAAAKIDGNTVILSSDAVPSPVSVRYCWGAGDLGTLINSAGLPASSFRAELRGK